MRAYEKMAVVFRSDQIILPLFFIQNIMAETENSSTLKRLQSRYRLVVMNDDTYEEVITFKLSRLSVYVALSSIFVLLVSLTVALLVLTPLKYYIPGYGNNDNRVELQALKMRTDSLEQVITYKDQYLDDIKKILGADTQQRDTTSLKVQKPEISND
jgi:hypothetical protein